MLMPNKDSLQARLDGIRDVVLTDAPPGIRKRILLHIQNLADGDILAKSKTGGDAAPDFTLMDGQGKEVRLGRELEQGPVVLSYYRGEWCPFCLEEVKALQTIYPDITALGGRLIAVSPQTKTQTATMVDRLGLSFDVLTDLGNAVAETYGLVFEADEAIKYVYREFGIELQKYNGDRTYRLPVPATYIIGQDGIIRWAFLEPDYTKRAEPEDILAQIRKLKEGAGA